jgi:hypothetical protein
MSPRTICPLGQPCLAPGQCHSECQRYHPKATAETPRKLEVPELLGAILWLRNHYDVGSVPPPDHAKHGIFDENTKRTVLAVIDALLQHGDAKIDFKGFRENWLPTLKVTAYEELRKEDARLEGRAEITATGKKRIRPKIKGRNLHQRRREPK